MERASKLFVVLWAITALAVEVLLVARGWEHLLPLSVGVFLVVATMAWFDRRTVAGVLVWTCVFPALIRLWLGNYTSQLDVLWLAGLLAAIVPDGLRRPWHIPRLWRGPLVCGVLAVAVSTPIVCWRELDFTASLLSAEHLSNSSIGGAPHYFIMWIIHVALVLVVGVLWFDWLCGLNDTRLLRRYVFVPLGISAAVMVGTAIYQLVGDVLFLNDTVYGAQGRASGTVYDGNVCGIVAALSIGGAAFYENSVRRQRAVQACALVLGWLAVWASGSRTGFLAATIISAFVLTSTIQSGGLRRVASARRALALAVLVTALLGVLASADSGVVGPWQRLRATLPGASSESVKSFVQEMWARNQYGTVSTRMVKDFPWFGIGIGCFPLMAADYATLISPGLHLPPDNAQNWLRHQVAELGVIGGAGWIAWVCGFGWFVLKGRRTAPPGEWIARGSLLAFGLVSLVGMPGQEALVAVIFWTLAYWYAGSSGAVPQHPAALLGRTWVVIAIVVTVHALGTTSLAANTLRVPQRAQRVGWPYSYGFYEPEPATGGGQQQWTGRHAVAVIDGPSTSFELTVSTNPPDIETRPVDAKVWVDGVLVVDVRLQSIAPVTRTYRRSGALKRVLIETEASRIFRPRDFGLADDRELGLLVRWRLVDPSARGE